MPRPGLGSASREITGNQPADWLEWMQLQNNVVGVNGPNGARTDGRGALVPSLELRLRLGQHVTA